MGFAAINAAAHQGKESRASESLEAQESRIANDYATGLRLVEEGRRSEALVSLWPESWGTSMHTHLCRLRNNSLLLLEMR